MANPYVGEIRMFAGNYAPVGWLLCQGQSVLISDYQTLYTLIGTTYGGDGISNFKLPNLASRIPLHQGTSRLGGATYVLGQFAGTETITLQVTQIPQHSHSQNGQTGGGVVATPAGTIPATPSPADNWYTSNAPNAGEALANPAMTLVGGGLPHDNIQPFLVINFIISMFGVFPTHP
jgi:microcystin-dependent protein